MPFPCAAYQPRDAERGVLYRVVQAHLDAFLDAAAQHAEGPRLPVFVEQEFRDFLTCGVLTHGFARLQCTECGFERLVPFSCKGRGFCPSCGGRRMTEFAARLVEAVLPRVPVRQWVLSLPYRLRYLLAWDHDLCRAVSRPCRTALRTSATYSLRAPVGTPRHVTRRRLLGLATAAAAIPLFGPLLSVRAYAAAHRDLRFRALRHGSPIGEHRVTFRPDGNRLTVETRVEIAVKVLFFTAFRFKHEAEEVWQSDRLVWVKSTTNDNGTLLQVSGNAVADGFRIIGDDGPFLASAHLLTSNALWDRRIVHANRLIDVQRGGEIGLVTKQLGDEQVDTPQGPVRASRHHMITPYYAGSVFHDSNGRWVKGLLELKGERVEYALAT